MKKHVVLILLFISFSSLAIKFNENEILSFNDEKKTLDSDEGYVYISLDSNSVFDYIEIKPVSGGRKLKFYEVENGKNYALVKLKKGNYYFSALKYTRYLKLGNKSIPIGSYIQRYDKTMHRFNVKNGVINYPGNWKTRVSYHGFDRSKLKLRLENDSFIAVQKLKDTFEDTLKKFKFFYNGKVKDEFIEFYESKNTPYVSRFKDENFKIKKPEKYTINQGVQDELEVFPNVWKYLKEDNSLVGRLSPNGKFLIYSTNVNEQQKIILFNTQSYESFVIYDNNTRKNTIGEIDWIDNDTLYYTSKKNGLTKHLIIHLSIYGNILSSADLLSLNTEGQMVSPLINQENYLLFAKLEPGKSNKNGLYRVDVSNQKSIEKSFKKKHLQIKKYKNIFYWLADKNGDLRFAVNFEPGKKDQADTINLLYLKDINTKNWQEIKSFSSEDDWILPDKISEDGHFFYVVTDDFSDKNQVHKYSTNDYSHQGVYFEDDRINVEGLVTNTSGEITGIAYVKNGFYKIDYFNQTDDSISALRKQNPNLKLYVVQKNSESNLLLIYGDNEYSKGAWFIHNLSTKKTIKVIEQDSEYKNLEKGEAHQLTIKSTDGLNIEGFLVIPKSNTINKYPLVVLPHGGPIGIRDFAYNDSVQHFFASQGIASLKVNYRGSSGKGKMFLDSGNGEWGSKIESDINQMVQYSIDNFAISENNICAMGSSYGGYSSIMLTILYPERYKCAVSLAGVTDLPLLFSSNQNILKNEEIYDRFVEIIGDPKENLESLLKKSPVYSVDNITKPILLFHGINDETVTIEHSYRLKALLDNQHKTNELILLNDEGHSLKFKNSNIIYVVRSLQFLKQYLIPGSSVN